MDGQKGNQNKNTKLTIIIMGTYNVEERKHM
jgi:hypothetical protein